MRSNEEKTYPENICVNEKAITVIIIIIIIIIISNRSPEGILLV